MRIMDWIIIMVGIGKKILPVRNFSVKELAILKVLNYFMIFIVIL